MLECDKCGGMMFVGITHQCKPDDVITHTFKNQIIDMVLFCPQCLVKHIDIPNPATGWDNPPHRSHECQACGHVWRPADIFTNGVPEIKTKGTRDGINVPDLHLFAKFPPNFIR